MPTDPARSAHRRAALVALWLVGSVGAAAAQGTAETGPDGAPVSAVPWLSDILRAPAGSADEPAATPLASSSITVTALGATRRDAVGLLPAAMTGLPRDLWGESDPARLAALLGRQPQGALPAIGALVRRLLLAELDPPRAAADGDVLFFARIDTLLRLGALDEAQALLEQAGATDPDAFRRWFDVSLLTGHDAQACEAMTDNPGIAPTLPARVFCLSRTGDWPAAALTLETGRALGAITPEEDALLFHFLDPELAEGLDPPVPPRVMTPLAFRLLDGIGETPATRDLPLAFAVADLRATSGWKQQIEAAERLTRVGAIDPNRLLSLYTDRRPSASGGVWERAAAVQRLDAALSGGDPAAVAAALPDAVARMEEAGLVPALATLFGEAVGRLDLSGPGGAAARRLALLSPGYAAAAEAMEPEGRAERFAVSVARGTPADPPEGMVAQAVADGLVATPPDDLAELAAGGRLGEAILQAALMLSGGAETDPGDIVDGLAFLRSVGLEDAARQTALEILLL